MEPTNGSSMYSLIIFFIFLIVAAQSAPIETCTFPNVQVTNETWPKIVNNLVQCLEKTVEMKDYERYDLLMSLAQELAKVANRGLSDTQNHTVEDNVLPSVVPANKQNELNAILLNHIRRVTEVMKTKLMIIDLSGARRIHRAFNFDNALVLVLLSAFLALSAMLAVVEIFISWKKYSRVRRFSGMPTSNLGQHYWKVQRPRDINGGVLQGAEDRNGRII